MYQIVKYRGDNCNPCKVLAPIFEEAKGRNTREDIEFHEVNIAEDEEQIKVLKIRTAQSPERWQQLEASPPNKPDT